MQLKELFKETNPPDINQFADYVLNKIKRDHSSVALEDGYIMSGHRCFIINDSFVTKKEAKSFIIKYLTRE